MFGLGKEPDAIRFWLLVALPQRKEKFVLQIHVGETEHLPTSRRKNLMKRPNTIRRSFVIIRTAISLTKPATS
jgi:hypothetical protein